jgi:hypothetical protein
MTVEVKFDSWEEFDKSIGSLTDIITAMGQANLEAQQREFEENK